MPSQRGVVVVALCGAIGAVAASRIAAEVRKRRRPSMFSGPRAPDAAPQAANGGPPALAAKAGPVREEPAPRAASTAFDIEAAGATTAPEREPDGPEVLSPELALVDPALAARARAALPPEPWLIFAPSTSSRGLDQSRIADIDTAKAAPDAPVDDAPSPPPPPPLPATAPGPEAAILPVVAVELRKAVVEPDPAPAAPSVSDRRAGQARGGHATAIAAALTMFGAALVFAAAYAPSTSENEGPGNREALSEASSPPPAPRSEGEAPAQRVDDDPGAQPAPSLRPRANPLASGRSTVLRRAPLARQRPQSSAPRAQTPARHFAWARAPRATGYAVRFLRDGRLIYAVRSRDAVVSVPASLLVTGRRHRWVVRPLLGPEGSRHLGAAIVNARPIVTPRARKGRQTRRG